MYIPDLKQKSVRSIINHYEFFFFNLSNSTNFLKQIDFCWSHTLRQFLMSILGSFVVKRYKGKQRGFHFKPADLWIGSLA